MLNSKTILAARAAPKWFKPGGKREKNILLMSAVFCVFNVHAAENLQQRLFSKDRAVNEMAVKEFTDLSIPEKKKLLPVFIEKLKDHDLRTRTLAASMVGLIGPEAKEAIPPLLAIVKNEKEAESLRTSAMLPLKIIGPSDENVNVGLRSVLINDPQIHIRAFAAAALSMTDSKESIMELIHLVKISPSPITAMTPVAVLRQLAASVFPRSIEDLSSKDRTVRIDAMNLIGQLVLTPTDLNPALAIDKETEEKSFFIGIQANAPIAMEINRAKPALENLTKDSDVFMKFKALEALEGIARAEQSNSEFRRLKGKAILESSTDILNDPRMSSHHQEAVDLLKNVGTPEALKAIKTYEEKKGGTNH